jgi:hypothetical protein
MPAGWIHALSQRSACASGEGSGKAEVEWARGLSHTGENHLSLARNLAD